MMNGIVRDKRDMNSLTDEQRITLQVWGSPVNDRNTLFGPTFSINCVIIMNCSVYVYSAGKRTKHYSLIWRFTGRESVVSAGVKWWTPGLGRTARDWLASVRGVRLMISTNSSKGQCKRVSFVHMLYFYRPQSRGDNTIGSVRVFVCVCVCLSHLAALNCFIYNLNFGMEVDLYLG